MGRIFQILVFIFCVLSLPAIAQRDFSEIHLPQPDKSGGFSNVLNDSRTVLTGTINVNEARDENIYSEIIPNHRLYFGKVRLYEDRTSFSDIQGHNDLGVKIQGGSGLINYSTGIYNINQAGGWVSINPLHHLPEAGKLDMGGGFYTNRLGVEDETEHVNSLTLFTGYKFSRFSTRGELIRKDYAYYDDEYYDIWKISNKLRLTKNLSLKAGYREYEQTNLMVNDYGVEYSYNKLKGYFRTAVKIRKGQALPAFRILTRQLLSFKTGILS